MRAQPPGALLTAFKVTRQVVVAAPFEVTDLTELLKQLETDFDVVADLHYRNRAVELILHTSPPTKSYASGPEHLGHLWNGHSGWGAHSPVHGPRPLVPGLRPLVPGLRPLVSLPYPSRACGGLCACGAFTFNLPANPLLCYSILMVMHLKGQIVIK